MCVCVCVCVCVHAQLRLSGAGKGREGGGQGRAREERETPQEVPRGGVGTGVYPKCHVTFLVVIHNPIGCLCLPL